MSPAAAPPHALTHLRILASAGAGKTYQLTSRYLRLVAAGIEPGSILASTFTRAAAGEIRDRLFLRLIEAVDDPKKRRELAAALGDDGLDESRVLALLVNLARHVHQLNIRTLDSYFAAVVNAFGLELGIPPGSTVVDEARAQQLRAEAVRQVLDERDPQPLVELLRQLIDDGAERAVTERIDQAVTDLYELSRDTVPGAWDALPEPVGRLTLPRLVDALQRLADANPTTDKRFVAAHKKSVEAARAHAWSALLTGGLARLVASGLDTYYNKTLPPKLVAAYKPVVTHARACVIDGIRSRGAAMRRLLERYRVQYEDVKRRDRALTFADLTHAMLAASRNERGASLGFRLDATIHHLLLDEFQDTSVGQWRALRPLVDEIAQAAPPERSFFCVGDVKQSIYGWRNAAPDILDQLPALLDVAGGLADEPLELSWRSAPPIIDAVNDVFLSVPTSPALDEFSEVRDTWDRWFRTHDTVHKDLPGRVEVHEAPGGASADERHRQRYRAAAELADALHRRAPERSLALLTRSRKAEHRLLWELGPTRLDVPVTGRGGGPLTDSPAVNAVLDLLQLADHPDDTIAAFNVAHSPLAGVVKASPSIATEAGRASRLRLASRVRRRLLDDGFAPTIAAWAGGLAPSCDARQVRRLLQLAELGEQFDADPTLRADDFIALVEDTEVTEAGPAPVQVMTIHQAKGLEFDIVILAELETQLTGTGRPPVVFERDGPAGSITRICPYIKSKLRPIVPELDPLFDAHRMRTVRESLCVLYVAMTRAKQGLYLLIDPRGGKPDSVPKTPASLIRHALVPDGASEGSVLVARGDDTWLDAPAKRDPSKEPAPPPATPIKLAPSRGRVRFGATLRPPSAQHEPGALAAQLRLPDVEAQDRGTAIHALLEQVEWIEDGVPDDAALRAVLQRTLPHRDDAWCAERVAELDTILARDPVRELLARGDRDATRVQVERELSFARVVEGRLQRGTIDRLEIELNDDGTPARARVIDFKTDRIEAEQAEESAAGYAGQLEVYRAAASEQLGLAPATIERVVLFVGPGVAVRLGG